MNIAIIDDNQNDLEEIRNDIEKFYGGGTCSIDSYACTDDFLSSLKSHSYDLIFLDIILEDENGIKVGESVNAVSPSTDIVFVSAHPEYFQDVYKARHAWFLTKPLDWYRFSDAMTRISARAVKGTVTIQARQGVERVPVSGILYLESNLKHTLFHMKDGSIADYSINMAEVEKQLPEIMFVRIHKSYIVNARDITKYNSRQVVLKGSINLPFGRTFYSSAREQLTRLLVRN